MAAHINFEAGKRFQSASIGLSLIALGAFMAVDWWLPSTAIFDESVVPLLGLGAISHAWTAPLSALGGRASFGDAWHLWQPFVGSQAFILQQALGWTLYALTLLALLYCVVDINGGRHPRGEITLVGVIALMSQVLFNISFRNFSPSMVMKQRGKRRKDSSISAFLSYRELFQDVRIWVSISLTVSATAILLYADNISASNKGQDNRVYEEIFFCRLSTALHFAAAFITHVLFGVNKLPGYRIFQPFSGEFAFLLLQAFAWLFLGIVADVALLLPSILKFGIAHLGGKMAAMGCSAQLLLFASLLRYRKVSKDGKQRDLIANKRPINIGWQRWLGMERYKGVSSIYIFAGALLFWSAALTLVCVVLIEEYGNHLLTGVSIMMMLVAAPMAHLGAFPMYPGIWRIWQPFAGGAKFAATQAVGWTCYSVSLAMWLIYFLNLISLGVKDFALLFSFNDVVRGVGPLTFLSSCVLILSVLIFDEDSVTYKVQSDPPLSTSGISRRSMKKSRINSVRPKSKRSKSRAKSQRRVTSNGKKKSYMASPSNYQEKHAWIPEEVLAMLIACFSMCLYVVSDANRQRYSKNEWASQYKLGGTLHSLLSSKSLTGFGFLGLSLIAPALVVAGGKRRWPYKYRVWQPFEGGVQFILWQAFGWTGVAMSALIQAILFSVSDSALELLGANSSPWLCSLVGGFPAFLSAYILLTSLTKYDAYDKASYSCDWRSTTYSRLPDMGSQNGNLAYSLVAQAVSVLVSVGSLLLFVLADFLIFKLESRTVHRYVYNSTILVLLFCASLAACLGMAITHIVCGPLIHKNSPGDGRASYNFFMPFQGGIPFCLLQAISWFLFGCGIVLTLMAFSYGPMNFPFFGILISVGLVFLGAQATLLLSLYFFDARKVSQYADQLKLDEKGKGNLDPKLKMQMGKRHRKQRNRSRGRKKLVKQKAGDSSTYSAFMSPKTYKKANDVHFRNAVVSGMLCVGSFSLFAIADAAILHYGPKFPAAPLIVCGIVAVCASAPLAFYFSPNHPDSHKTEPSFLMTSSSLVGAAGWAMWSFTVILGFWVLLNLFKSQKQALTRVEDLGIAEGSFAKSDVVAYNFSNNGPSYQSRLTQWLSIAGLLAQIFLYVSVVRPPSISTAYTTHKNYYNSRTSSLYYFGDRVQDVIRKVGSGKVLFFCMFLATRTYILSVSVTMLTFIQIQLGGLRQAAYIAVFFASIFLFPFLHPASIASKRLANAPQWLWNRTFIWVWRHMLRRPVGAFASILGRMCILPILRVWLDYPMWLYHYWWFHHGSGHISQDGLPVRQGVSVSRGHRYGTHPKEELDILSPMNGNKACRNRGALIFVHGGGWVAVNREVMSQSLTPFVRAGFTVYSIDYPLAPEDRFPFSLVSVLRAAAWVKQYTGEDKLTLVGDSAGGNLATMATAILSNKTTLLPHLSSAVTATLEDSHFDSGMLDSVDPQTASAQNVEKWDYPRVDRVVSMYGIVDSQAWRGPIVASDGIQSPLLQFMWNVTAILLDFCFNCYAPLTGSRAARLPISAHLTIGDLLACSDMPEGEKDCEERRISIQSYPPTLLICGTADPLVRANRKVQSLLETRLGTLCLLKEFPGPHAFHGIPPQWTLDGWRSNSYPTTREMISFLTSGEVNLPENTVFQPHDWSLPFVLAAHGVVPLLLLWQLSEAIYYW